MKRIPNKNGFTLIELLVVIAVLGVLAAGIFVAINPLKRIGQANDARIKSDIGQISNAMQAYYITHQSYPATVRALVDSGELKTEPKKPDGSSYTITTPDGCAVPCADVIVSAPLAQPQTTGSSYQWSSATGIAGEAAPLPTATPAPTATGTPIPTPLLACVSNGLIGYWDFDEGTGSTVSDKKGSGTGTWNGTLGSQWIAGKFGTTAGNFNGTNNYVNVPNYSATVGLSAITVAAWINTSTTNPGGPYGEGRIVNWSGNTILFQILRGGKLNVWINNTGNFQTGEVLAPNVWRHVAFTWTTSGAIVVYVNGGAVATGTLATTAINGSASDLRFGTYTGDATVSLFTGIIDDVRIYNRVLSPSEINSFYNNNFGCKP